MDGEQTGMSEHLRWESTSLKTPPNRLLLGSSRHDTRNGLPGYPEQDGYSLK